MIKTYKDLEVYQLAYKLAMDLFRITKDYPKEEQYSLTSQLIRSSRSVGANIAEGWAKRPYENYFKQHLIHALGSNSETDYWLDISKDCGYIDIEQHEKLIERNSQVGKMLTRLHQNWKTY